MWDLVERGGEAWITYGQQPMLQLDPERDARIVAPARDKSPQDRSQYLQGVLDGWSKHKRDQGPLA